jgi:septal ring factor EnvC (AmiA/AmiB activator)
MQHISFVKRAFLCFLLVSVMSFAAQKTAGGYYRDAAFQYIENRLPTAEITCKEGLSYYPNDMKLQMLLDRIQEAKEEQKNKNKEQNQDQQDQNQDQEQNKDQQDQNQDQEQNQDQQDQNQDQEQNKDQQDQNQDQEQNQDQQDQNQDQGQNDEQNQDEGKDPNAPQEVPVGQMSPEEASQLLKDFNEQNGEQKPWKPVRGQARPLKDW